MHNYLEYQNLIGWFNGYYREHEEKYRRLIYLKLNNDDGSNPSDSLKALYLLAETKRKQIQELELILDGEKCTQ